VTSRLPPKCPPTRPTKDLARHCQACVGRQLVAAAGSGAVIPLPRSQMGADCECGWALEAGSRMLTNEPASFSFPFEHWPCSIVDGWNVWVRRGQRALFVVASLSCWRRAITGSQCAWFPPALLASSGSCCVWASVQKSGRDEHADKGLPPTNNMECRDKRQPALSSDRKDVECRCTRPLLPLIACQMPVFRTLLQLDCAETDGFHS